MLPLQNLTTTMIHDVANDFEFLEFSPATAGAVLDTLALVSGSETSLTSDSQVGSLKFEFCPGERDACTKTYRART